MNTEDILKRVKRDRNKWRNWQRYEIAKNDIRRVAQSPDDYQQAIKRLKVALKI